MGRVRPRDLVLPAMRRLPQATVATDLETLGFIDRHRLFGLGIGYIDAHLLAAVRLTPGAALWTHDKRLRGAAERLGTALPFD